MAAQKANEVNFAKDIDRLRTEAQAAGFSSEINPVNSGSVLDEYFHHYGFTAVELTTETQYSIGTFDYQGLCIVAHWWRRTASRGTVCVVHGLFDHVGLYLKVVRILLEQGYNVFALDAPGHGLSEGPSAEVNDFSEYVDVLELALEKICASEPPTNLFLLGQSTGAAAVALYLMTGKYKTRIAGAVLLAPLLRPVSWWYVNWGWMLAHHFVSKVPRRFAANSNDNDFLEFLVNRDPLQPQTISLPWVAAMRKWVKRFVTFPACATPVLIIQGDADGTVDWRNNIPIFQTQFPNNKTVLLTGARHHLVNESSEHLQRLESEIADFLKQKS